MSKITHFLAMKKVFKQLTLFAFPFLFSFCHGIGAELLRVGIGEKTEEGQDSFAVEVTYENTSQADIYLDNRFKDLLISGILLGSYTDCPVASWVITNDKLHGIFHESEKRVDLLLRIRPSEKLRRKVIFHNYPVGENDISTEDGAIHLVANETDCFIPKTTVGGVLFKVCFFVESEGRLKQRNLIVTRHFAEDLAFPHSYFSEMEIKEARKSIAKEPKSNVKGESPQSGSDGTSPRK